MRAKRRALSAEARNAAALEAASPASFQPWNAHTIAGALRPSGRRSQISGCIRTTVHHARMASATRESTQAPHSIATLRPGDEVDGVFACTRKERQLSRAGGPYLTVELRDGTRKILPRALR